MAKLKIIITDDNGEEINTHSYELGNNLSQISEMERSIEKLRPEVLCDITKDLLSKAQSLDKKKVQEATKR